MLTEHTVLKEATVLDYKILSRYHYQPQLSFPPTKIFKLTGDSQFGKGLPDPLAVIVFSQPFPEIVARTRATAGCFHQLATLAENLTVLNKHVLYLSRLITDPRFLRRGLATKLLHETLAVIDTPIIETLTPIDFTNHMYVKAGFEFFINPISPRYVRMMQAFSRIGLQVKETTPYQLIDARLKKLPPRQSEFIEREIALFLAGFRNADRFKPDTERTKFILSKIPPPTAYLIWFNPKSDTAQQVKQYRDNIVNNPT